MAAPIITFALAMVIRRGMAHMELRTNKWKNECIESEHNEV